MINRAHAWFAAFVVIIFAAGLAAGVALDRALDRGRRPAVGANRPSGPGAPGNGDAFGRGGGGGRRGGGGGDFQGPPVESFVAELDDALHLTADQKTQVAAILEASRPRLRALQDDASKRFADEQKKVSDEIDALLTPEQRTALAELRKTRRGPFGLRGGRGGPRGR